MPVVNANVISNPNRDAPNPWAAALNTAAAEVKGYNAEQQRMLENETNIRLKDYDSKREEIGLMLLSPDEGVKTQAMNMIKQRFALEGRATGQGWNDADLEQLALQEATFLSQLTPERGAKAYAMYHVPEAEPAKEKQVTEQGVRPLPGQSSTEAITQAPKPEQAAPTTLHIAQYRPKDSSIPAFSSSDFASWAEANPNVKKTTLYEGTTAVLDNNNKMIAIFPDATQANAYLKNIATLEADKKAMAQGGYGTAPGSKLNADAAKDAIQRAAYETWKKKNNTFIPPDATPAQKEKYYQDWLSSQVSLNPNVKQNMSSVATEEFVPTMGQFYGKQFGTQADAQGTTGNPSQAQVRQAPTQVRQATGAVNAPPPENIMQFGARMAQEQAQANAQAQGEINPAQRQAQILAQAQGMAGPTSIPSLAQQMQARSQATGATAPSSANVPSMFQRQAPTQAQSPSTSQTSSSSDLGNVKRDFQAMIANQPLARQNLAMETFENMTRVTPNLTPAQENSVNKINLEVEKTIQDIVPQGAKLPTTPQEKAQESQNFSRLVRSTSALVNSPTVKSWSKEMDKTYKARFNSLDAEDLSAAGLEGAGNIRAQKEVAKINGEYALAAAAIKAEAEKGNATAKNMETIAKYSMEMLQLIRGKSTLSEAELLKTNETYKGYTNIMGKLLGLGESDVKRIPIESKPFWQPLVDWFAPTQEVIAVGGASSNNGTAAVADMEKAKAISEKFKFNTNK